MTEIVSTETVDLVLDHASTSSLVHGQEHWRCVAEAGLRLVEATDADPTTVFLFGVFHDSMRWNDWSDRGHGHRAGQLVAALSDGLGIDPERRRVLIDACEGHSDGELSTDPTIAACWDADRLDLWWVGRRPRPGLLSTDAAVGLIGWAETIRPPRSWAELAEAFHG